MTTFTPLSFTLTDRDGTLIVTLRGTIDSALSLDAALESTMQSKATHVIVMLTDVEYINSAGFGSVIRFSEAVTEAERTLYIVGLESKVHVVFHSLGAHDILNILPTLDDALKQIAKS